MKTPRIVDIPFMYSVEYVIIYNQKRATIREWSLFMAGGPVDLDILPPDLHAEIQVCLFVRSHAGHMMSKLLHPSLMRDVKIKENIPILSEAFLTFASKIFFRPLLSIQWTLYSMYSKLWSAEPFEGWTLWSLREKEKKKPTTLKKAPPYERGLKQVYPVSTSVLSYQQKIYLG